MMDKPTVLVITRGENKVFEISKKGNYESACYRIR
jgi:hypothetical protein